MFGEMVIRHVGVPTCHPQTLVIILWFVGIAVQENAHNSKEFSWVLDCAMDAYAGALVFLWGFIWRLNHRVFRVRRRRSDRSFMCRRCGIPWILNRGALVCHRRVKAAEKLLVDRVVSRANRTQPDTPLIFHQFT